MTLCFHVPWKSVLLLWVSLAAAPAAETSLKSRRCCGSVFSSCSKLACSVQHGTGCVASGRARPIAQVHMWGLVMRTGVRNHVAAAVT